MGSKGNPSIYYLILDSNAVSLVECGVLRAVDCLFKGISSIGFDHAKPLAHFMEFLQQIVYKIEGSRLSACVRVLQNSIAALAENASNRMTSWKCTYVPFICSLLCCSIKGGYCVAWDAPHCTYTLCVYLYFFCFASCRQSNVEWQSVDCAAKKMLNQSIQWLCRHSYFYLFMCIWLIFSTIHCFTFAYNNFISRWLPFNRLFCCCLAFLMVHVFGNQESRTVTVLIAHCVDTFVIVYVQC